MKHINVTIWARYPIAILVSLGCGFLCVVFIPFVLLPILMILAGILTDPPPLGKMPRGVSMVGPNHKALLSASRSQETFLGKTYLVRSSHFRPEYFSYKDWGAIVLYVKEISDGEDVYGAYGIGSTNDRKGCITISGAKSTLVTYTKNLITLCYNDALGSVYKTTLPVGDPRVPCLFYDSKNKNRKELVEARRIVVTIK